VPSIPLIASSVMSKKIAAGAQAIVLDVKVGSGAFMPDLKSATALAQAMVNIGQKAGRKVVAVISDMNQPLGNAVGNALEVREALEALCGGGPADLREHCLLVGGHLLVLAGKARTVKAAQALLEAALSDGRALARFRQMAAAQGGDVRVVDDPGLLPKAPLAETVPAPRSGYLAQIDAREVGLAAVDLGAGRARKGDPLDYAVGLVVHHKVGERVKKGEPLFTVHANDPARLAAAKERVLAAHRFSARPVKPLPLFYKVIKSR
jgi:pyrimidine-nucleoside phosphorylase